MKPPKQTARLKQYMLHAAVLCVGFLMPFLLRASSLSPSPQFLFSQNNYGWVYLYVSKGLIWIAYFYLNVYLFLPMLWQKKAWLFATCQLACLVAVHGVAFGLLHIFIHNYINPAYKLVDLIYYNAAPFLFVLLASVTYIFFVERPKKASLYKAQAQFENVSGGPQAAIKPEFVHTTLGTLLELMKDKPAKAEPVMVKLTSLIEYMMLEPGGNKVSLEMEIDNLKKYIYFTRHRFGNSISLSVPGNIVNESYEVEHLILLRSLQGTLDAKNGMVPGEHIDIYLFNKNNLLNFVISSSIGANGNAVLMPSASGLQANNVRRKLIVNSYQKNNLN